MKAPIPNRPSGWVYDPNGKGFSKCQISDGDCRIPAEWVESINGRACKCDDLKSGVGLNCMCT